MTTTKQPTLTKADLIEDVLRVTDLQRKESETVVETIFESIIESLQKGEKIEIRGFGSFRTRQRRGHASDANPKTGCQGRCSSEADSILQAQQRAKGFRQ